ncbi:MAG: hypothetical protein HWE30_10025 [Methylocystaceae bacterium]|nr:hypothetical protein [Methylocystaceae bacterium]
MMGRKLVMVMLVAACMASLSACGRKNAPIAPQDVDPKYPRTYPAPVETPKMYK